VCDVWKDRREGATRKVNESYAARLGKNYRSCQAYRDFREVLDRDDIDAVLIATPAHWHATMAAMAAEAGKDIYCEKPTAVTIQESQAVLRAVRRYGRVYQAGTQQRSEYGGKFRLAGWWRHRLARALWGSPTDSGGPRLGSLPGAGSDASF
jgi:predicted dehydrogenase